MSFYSAIILGIVEGLLEFLPVSAAGNLTIVARLLNIPPSNFIKVYEIVMQVGAVFAVVLLYRKKLYIEKKIWIKIIAGFIPTGIVGFLFYKPIKHYLLYNDKVTIASLIVGGIILIIIDRIKFNPKIRSLEEINTKTAIKIGIIQCLAFIPGVSRSGATIVGGMLLGLEKKVAAEFSFLLAIPTILSAASYSLLKEHAHISSADIRMLGISFITALIFAVLSVKLFLRFISSHEFTLFGIYRILISLYYIFVK